MAGSATYTSDREADLRQTIASVTPFGTQRFRIVRKRSTAAAALYADSFFDWVYIGRSCAVLPCYAVSQLLSLRMLIRTRSPLHRSAQNEPLCTSTLSACARSHRHIAIARTHALLRTHKRVVVAFVAFVQTLTTSTPSAGGTCRRGTPLTTYASPRTDH